MSNQPHQPYDPQQHHEGYPRYGTPDPYANQDPYAQPGYAQPGHQQPGYAQPGYGQAPYGAQDPHAYGNQDSYGNQGPYAGHDPYAQQQPQQHPQQHPQYQPQQQPQPVYAAAAPEPQYVKQQPGTVPPQNADAPRSADAPRDLPGEPRRTEEGSRPMTAAEKARAEGRAQIINPGLRPALLTTVLAALLAATAPVARPALAVPLVLLQAVTAAGWFRLNGMWPARQGIALAFLSGVAADIGLLATDRDQAPTVLIGTLGVWLLLVVVLQLRSHASPDERLYGLTAAAASSAVTVLAAGYLAAVAESSDAVVVGAAAVAVAALARSLPLPTPVSVVVALLAATGAGVAMTRVVDTGNADAAMLAFAAGACAVIGLRVASYDYPSRFVHFTAGVALPLAAAAPAVYVIGRALG